MKLNHWVYLALGLLLFGCQSSGNEFSILYFTDGHEIAPVNDRFGVRGGVARLKTVVDDFKANNINTITIFGGDLGGGTLFGGFYHGLPMVEAFNEIPLDLANFGQHDFDFGIENTLQLIENSDFQWVTSNLKDTLGNSFASLPESIIIERSGIKVGFIALIDALNTSIQDKRLVQEDMIQAANHEIKKLQTKGVDYIVAITQTPIPENEKLLIACPSIDLVFTEEISENRTNIIYVGNRPIISTAGNMGSIASATLRKDDDGKINSSLSVFPLDSLIEENSRLKALDTKYMDSLNNKLSSTIAVSTSKFDKSGSRIQENELGNLIADAFRDYYNADIGLMNGGGIRANIEKGDILMKDAYSVLPFGNSIFLTELNGKDIIEILNNGVSAVNKRGGDFIQVSGLSYSFKINNQGAPEILTVESAGSRLEMNKKYKVALSSYILTGGGNFNPISSEQIIDTEKSIKKDVEIFIEFLNQQKTISPYLNNRILVFK